MPVTSLITDAPAVAPDTHSPRLLPLDALRGLVMVLMALDHANHFIGHLKGPHELWTGTFPSYGNDWGALLVRVVTHLAAPGFALLMGAGVALMAHRRQQQGWSTARLAWRLVARGLLLIVMQVLFVDPVWQAGIGSGEALYLGVLWALGCALMLAPPLLRVPTLWLASGSALLLLLVQALLPDPSANNSFMPAWQRLLLAPGFGAQPALTWLGVRGYYILYPVLPWLAIVGLGMAGGKLLAARDNSGQRELLRQTLWMGLGCLVAWALVRGLNSYGNIRPRPDGLAGWLNMVKYPPSLSYCLATLGLNLVLLGLLARAKNGPLLDGMAVYGRTPLVFYVVHLWVYWLLGLLAGDAGRGLPNMLPFWLLGLANLLPVCFYWGKWRAKQSAESWWRLL